MLKTYAPDIYFSSLLLRDLCIHTLSRSAHVNSPTVAHSFPNGVWLVRKPGLQKLANCSFEKQVCQTIFGLLCVWTFNCKTISRKLCCFKLKTLDTAVFTEVLCCYLAFSTCCASQNVISNLVREQLCVNMVFVVILESALWSVNYIQLSCYRPPFQSSNLACHISFTRSKFLY